MNILYLADPNSIHDLKWISFFSIEKKANAYVVPQYHQYKSFTELQDSELVMRQFKFILLPPVRGVSVVRFYRSLYDLHVLRKLTREYDIELIHVLYAEPGALWSLGRNYLRVPMILSTRGTDILYTIPNFFTTRGLINKIVSKMYKRAINRVDWITVTSVKQATIISKLTGRKSNMNVIRTGVDIDRIKSDTSEFLPSELKGKDFILFPRLIRPVYNHELSIAAINLLSFGTKQNFKMVFVGMDEPASTYVKLIESQMNELADEVEFVRLPKQSQLAIWELYKRASLVVMTPKSDGSPVSAMEAAVCGARVILPPLDYDYEVFDESFLRLKSFDAQELTLLMEQTLYLEKLRPILDEKKFDRRVYMSKLWKIYQSLTGIQQGY